MNENEKMLNILVLAAETVFGVIVTETQTTDPAAHAQAHKWLLTPGSRVELRIDIGSLVAPTPTTNIRCVVVDSGDEPLWEVFTRTTESAPC